MTKENEEIIERLGFCGGTLELIRSKVSMDYYESAQQSANSLFPVRVVFEKNGEYRRIDSLQELGDLAKEIKCDVEKYVTDHESGFALIIAHLLRRGRLVSSVDLFGFLERDFDLSIKENRPRIENHKLRFLIGKFSLTEDHQLFDVVSLLPSLQSTISEINRREPM